MIFEDVIILKNDEIASGIWKMEFSAPKIKSYYKGAGQFIQIQVESGREYPLRRPMSIAGCEESTMSIIYKIFGTGTSILSQKFSGETINVLGPLGNIFNLHNNHSHIFVGGGVGLAPIVNMWNQINDKELCENKDNPEVFACGPEPMLKAVQSYVTVKHIPAQLAVESYMGCGVGICQGCVISRRNNNKKNHSYHERYSLVCIDGPVYNAGEIIFD